MSKPKGKGVAETKVTKVDKGATNSEECAHCHEDVTDEQNGLQCEVCEGWYHAECQDMTQDTYKIMNQDCIHWFCKRCDKRVSKLVKTVAKLEERQDRMEVELKGMKGEIEGVKTDIQKVVEKTESIDTKLETIIEAKLCKSVEDLRKSNEDTVQVSREDVLEEIEISKRRMNIVINGIKENEDEREVVKDVIAKLVGARGVASISDVERIGIRSSDKKKHRMVRVIFTNVQVKFDILKAAPEVRDYPEFKKLFISPDLTKRQQEKDKVLRDKLKECRENGASEAKIKRGQVVKKENGVEVVVYPLPPQLL